MHAKVVLFFFTAFLAAFVCATEPVTITQTVTATAPAATVTTISQCNTGTISCCNTVQTASSSPVSALLGLLGIALGEVTGLIGLGCTPISILGIGSGVSCNAQPVCCTNVQFNGLINLGCNAISL